MRNNWIETHWGLMTADAIFSLVDKLAELERKGDKEASGVIQYLMDLLDENGY